MHGGATPLGRPCRSLTLCVRGNARFASRTSSLPQGEPIPSAAGHETTVAFDDGQCGLYMSVSISEVCPLAGRGAHGPPRAVDDRSPAADDSPWLRLPAAPPPSERWPPARHTRRQQPGHHNPRPRPPTAAGGGERRKLLSPRAWAALTERRACLLDRRRRRRRRRRRQRRCRRRRWRKRPRWRGTVGTDGRATSSLYLPPPPPTRPLPHPQQRPRAPSAEATSPRCAATAAATPQPHRTGGGRARHSRHA